MDNSKFENVTIVKKANIYFGGKVSSRNIYFADGSRKTLGFMLPGDYEFRTTDREIMEILEGDIDVMFSTNEKWFTYVSGQSFTVQANSKFKLRLLVPVDYCCSYG